MTVTEDTARDRGYAPHFEHSSSEINGKWIICQECAQNLLTINNLAADLRDMADWPGSDDGHDDISRLLRSFTSIVEIARKDNTPELIARDLGDFLEARQNRMS